MRFGLKQSLLWRVLRESQVMTAKDSYDFTTVFLFHPSVAGIVLVTLSDSESKPSGISFGALWALGGAFL